MSTSAISAPISPPNILPARRNAWSSITPLLVQLRANPYPVVLRNVGHSLCHGDLGNLELLLSAGETLDAPYWRSQTQRLSAIVLESIGRDGWLCGAPLGVESPGPMTGLVGIGYELLRLANPGGVPSVLVLAPPQL